MIIRKRIKFFENKFQEQSKRHNYKIADNSIKVNNIIQFESLLNNRLSDLQKQ